ncbi:hypothetical protein ACVS6L_001725 [Campylobacter fetus]
MDSISDLRYKSNKKSITNSNIEILSEHGLIALRENEAKMLSCELLAEK